MSGCKFKALTLRLTRISLNSPGAEVTYMNMTAYNKGRLQSSFWIVDKQHVYIGSAGLDWQSLGQVIFPRYINSELCRHQSSQLHTARGAAVLWPWEITPTALIIFSGVVLIGLPPFNIK